MFIFELSLFIYLDIAYVLFIWLSCRIFINVVINVLFVWEGWNLEFIMRKLYEGV